MIRLAIAVSAIVVGALCAVSGTATAEEPQATVPPRIDWRDDMLTIQSPLLPTGELKVWYLEAYCRTGSTNREWGKTVIPHETRRVDTDQRGERIELESIVEPGIEVQHILRAVADGIDIRIALTNTTINAVDIDWAQPCMRVDTFTGLDQATYIQKCFIFTKDGIVFLDRLPRTEEAIYRGGQVYVPKGINKDDVNPRPMSTVTPAHNIIGCTSADDRLLVAMAWDQVQELFQGVITCIHADFRVGGLKPGETKQLHGKIYLMKNAPDKLLEKYREDFPE